jgi:hypothetical protein
MWFLVGIVYGVLITIILILAFGRLLFTNPYSLG